MSHVRGDILAVNQINNDAPKSLQKPELLITVADMWRLFFA